MNMDEVLASLYETLVTTDPVNRKKLQQVVKAAQPSYDRLCQALGDKEGEQIWSDALDINAAEQELAFHSGLCLGLRLMALSL